MGSHTAGAFARTLQSSRKSRRSARADIENGANVGVYPPALRPLTFRGEVT